MSTSTTNLGLTKPSGNERPDVDIINANMDTIDAAIGAVGNVSLQSQITSLRESVSQLNLGSGLDYVGFYANDSGYATIRFAISENNFYQIYINPSGISWEHEQNGQTTTLWTK